MSAERRQEASDKKVGLKKRTTLGSFSAEIAEVGTPEGGAVSRSPELALNAEPLAKEEVPDLLSPVTRR